MKVKITLLCTMLLVASTVLCGQEIIGSAAANPVDSAASITYDSSQYRVYYQLSRRKVPKGTKKEEGFTVLQIGKKGYLKNMDYATFRTDSIIRIAARNKESMGSCFGKLMSLHKQVVLDIDLLFSPVDNQFVVQEIVPLSERFQYTDDIKDLEWNMVEGDTIVADYKCQKALTTFRGRDYIAWYAPEIALPYGPYKFLGLPGLILCIYDTDRDYVFTLAGLQTINDYDPIFTKEKFIKESRENIQSMIANYHADPSITIRNNSRIHIDEKDLGDIPPKPYNPIERQ